MDIQENLTLLKLGGSLITDKKRPHTVRMEVLTRLASEIKEAKLAKPDLHLIIGHGSGSFGHTPAKKYGTRDGVISDYEWGGFVEVWHEAAALNRLVIKALSHAGLQILSFPPSASVIADEGKVSNWDLAVIEAALKVDLTPVVFGDVVFDKTLGGTILSTEDLFAYIVHKMRTRRILLAGLEPGIWMDYHTKKQLLVEITPSTSDAELEGLSGSAYTDVTGGMASKVKLSLELVRMNPDLSISIFSGEKPGFVRRALTGEQVGTLIYNGY